MNVQGAVNIDDLRKLAKKRLPKIAFDFIEGGVEDEDGLDRNERMFREHRLVPRYLIDVSKRDQSQELFGRTYSSPFGISPTGLASLFRPGADLMLAEAAKRHNVPFIMSGSSTASMEDLAKVAPDHGWYQLYAAKDKTISEDMVKRAADAGLSTLVLTVDVPVHSKRERNVRNGFSRPLKMTMRTKLEALRHPGWMMEYMKMGTPFFPNWAKYAGTSNPDKVADFTAGQTAAPLDWKHVERFRELFPGTFILKGIMHPDDALRAADMGIDGITVSNHGARQLDRAPSPLEVLPAIGRAVGDRVTLMLDSGVRRGSDVALALCLGAKFVFLGRPTLYGAAAGGIDGAMRALDILEGELDLTMAQMGAPTLRDLGPEFLLWDDDDDLRRNRRP